eukprot:1108221-Pleurochrysis_carterae.AAC.1
MTPTQSSGRHSRCTRNHSAYAISRHRAERLPESESFEKDSAVCSPGRGPVPSRIFCLTAARRASATMRAC